MTTAARILIVDDDDFNRLALARRLKQQGYSDLTEARDGREALERIRAGTFDLVLLDIMMPEMTGYEVLEQLRVEGRLANLPILVISASDELDSVVRCIELGAEDYLPKSPFNLRLMRARVGAALEKKRLRDEVARQLRLIQEVFGKYVPERVAQAIVAGQGKLEPALATVTILYTDIESFTSLAETMPPDRVVQMLNEYFSAMTEPIHRHGGVINQFQGDAMLVTFNVPVADPHHADHAVQTALEMQAASQGRTFAGVSVRTRIGVSTGQAIAGNVGSGDRVNYTVHGDAVNLAARLESLNKEYGSQVLIAGTTVDLLTGAYPLESIGAVAVRGRSVPVRIFKLKV